ncbi:hypothetical protein J2Y45_005779 [Dyadobacter sp. BE34]|uniref:Glycine zipper domain-containing protein n=1 Tax=Dyadobacter fermentans TaxID=94254 RepID=A0ABU1R581_9BACT|nr:MULTISPECIES: hypothetical protein [Dyadobacter]MDR6808567.1 hypothetical protein [Dyadobacter fermentans]MDR7046310.1 hypothetical protein [Dyadobacter sp. BE242]MDR7200623.1 hypothetical protein [Dyadobacter sp. BE34]MDR7218583.1 hypothetical protein [Dyadobacter sp. BE31]MDR7266513.1 hypothetical protein [Dyadobacter sp. BE32]
MNSNPEKYELATPLIFGTAIGSFGTLLGPMGAIAGFAVGVGLGFWFDKKAEGAIKSKDTTPLKGPEKKTICH